VKDIKLFICHYLFILCFNLVGQFCWSSAAVMWSLADTATRWWKILRVLVEMLWFYVKIAPFGLRMYHGYFISHNRAKSASLDLAYGPLPRNRVDVYTQPTTKQDLNAIPDAAQECAVLAPMVVFIHGGAWSSGGKHQYGTLARALQARGLAVAVANYTLHPAGQVQQMVRDLALLFKFIERNAHSFGADLVPLHHS
jgi:acetyl esterase/lipase